MLTLDMNAQSVLMIGWFSTWSFASVLLSFYLIDYLAKVVRPGYHLHS